MLARLRIEKLALVDELEVELRSGLNVVSGETGAGKSVLIDAIALLVGERADTAAIQGGADRAVVEGVFRLDDPALRRRVADLVGEETDDLALRRELHREQRGRCYAGGRLCSASLLRELGEVLLELHGQHEHQLLLRRPTQRELLDAFGGLESERLALAREFQASREIRRRLEEVRAGEVERAERLVRLREEVDDIRGAEIDLEREAERQEEAERLRDAEDRVELAARAAGRLSQGGDEAAGAEGVVALDRLRAAEADLRLLARRERRLEEVAERFNAAVDEVESVVRALARYLDGLVRDPVRLADLDAREALLLRLMRRYATDLPGLLEREARARAEIAELEARSGQAVDLEREAVAVEGQVRDVARALSRGRERAARELASSVRGHLRDLGLARGDFEARLERGELEAAGFERVEFLIAPNPGEPAAPLRSIASGGELSRVVLALKAALAAVDRVPTLVFDEVDVGIGGRVAARVAAKLRAIAERRQVIAVTHLAQIAAPAARHLRMEKVVRGDRTRIAAAALEEHERLEELGRMLGGAESASARRYARELLERARGSSRPSSRPRAGAA